MRDFEKKMLKEADKLAVRVNRIKLYMQSERFKNLPEVEQQDLKTQFEHMDAYLCVLCKRIVRIVVD